MLAIKYKWMLPLCLKQSSIPDLSACQGNAGMKEESPALQWAANAAVYTFCSHLGYISPFVKRVHSKCSQLLPVLDVVLAAVL